MDNKTALENMKPFDRMSMEARILASCVSNLAEFLPADVLSIMQPYIDSYRSAKSAWDEQIHRTAVYVEQVAKGK